MELSIVGRWMSCRIIYRAIVALALYHWLSLVPVFAMHIFIPLTFLVMSIFLLVLIQYLLILPQQ